MSFKVSIIVPVYNVQKYLATCLNSLINQTLRDIEIICINDGSTDNSGKILEEFVQKDSRIKVITQQNKGQSVARNTGIEYATGEYLGFVDSDDFIDLDYFEKLYFTAKENNSDIACAGFKRCGKFMSSVRKSYNEVKIYTNINDKVLIDKIPEHNYLWNKIYKRNKWHFKFEEGKFFEDVAILIKILFYCNKMVTVPGTYYNYRKNQNSTVSSKNIKNKQDYKWAMNELFSFANANGIALPKYKQYRKREIFKFCGMTVLKIYYYDDVIKYKYLGFIPLFEKYEC